MTLTHLLFQIYSEMIGNVMTDARSTGKYYHCKFISILCVMKLDDFFIKLVKCVSGNKIDKVYRVNVCHVQLPNPKTTVD